MGLTDKHLAYGDDIPQTQAEKDYYWELKNLKEKQQVSKKGTGMTCYKSPERLGERMKDYSVLDELIPKTQELHRAIFDKGYEQGKADALNQQPCEDIATAFQFGIAMGFAEKYDEMDRVMEEVKKATTPKQQPCKDTKKTCWHMTLGKFICSCGYIRVMDDADMIEWRYCPVCGGGMEVNNERI